MNHSTVPLRRLARRGRLFSAVLLALAPCAALAPSAGAAIGEHHFLPGLSHAEQFQKVSAVATDPRGDLYVADSQAGKIKILGPAGQSITEFATSANDGGPSRIAVDDSGDVYVLGGEEEVVKYAPSAPLPPTAGTMYSPDTSVNGTGVLVSEGSEATSLAIDPSTGDVYVNEGDQIASYAPGGALLSPEMGKGLTAGDAPYGSIGVYEGNHEIYGVTARQRGEDAVQWLEITGATGGTYDLSFEGESTGWTGTGTLTSGSDLVTDVVTASGRPTFGSEVGGAAGIEAGTKIEAFDPVAGTIELSQPATADETVAFSADLPYAAGREAIAAALEALPAIGEGNLSILCENEEGEIPTAVECEIEFQESLAFTDVGQISASDADLTGPDPTAEVSTVFEGEPEVPEEVYVLNAAGTGVVTSFDGSTSPAGGLGGPERSTSPQIAVDQSNGDVFVGDVKNHHVVDEFDAGGAFVSGFDPTFGSTTEPRFTPDVSLAVDNGGSSPNPRTIYVAAEKSVYAFGPTVRGYPLTLEKGSHGGTVESEPAGILCGPSCAQQAEEFEEGQSIVLKAPAGPGARFLGWETGDCDEEVSGADGTECKVTMNAARTVKANFAHTLMLTVTPAGGPGSGTVTSSPGGISCGSTCEAEFDEASTVTLTATPSSGFRLAGWTNGSCKEVTGADGTECKVTMSSAKLVEPRFAPAVGLTVAKSGDGSGTVTSSPGGISCGSICEAEFAAGDTVTLTATAAGGSHFVGWLGGGCTGTGTCPVTVSAATTVTADFAADPPPSQSSPTPTPNPTPTPTPTPPPTEGAPRLARRATVGGGKADLKISCGGAGACSGTLKLTARVNGKTIVLGTAHYAVGAGRSKAVKVKLTAAAKRLLAAGAVKAKVSGGGLYGTVTLEAPPR